jgi:hypothetical protein
LFFCVFVFVVVVVVFFFANEIGIPIAAFQPESFELRLVFMVLPDDSVVSKVSFFSSPLK